MSGPCSDYKTAGGEKKKKSTKSWQSFPLHSANWNKTIHKLNWEYLSSNSKSTEIFVSVTGEFCCWKGPLGLILILGDSVLSWKSFLNIFVFFKNTIYHH